MVKSLTVFDTAIGLFIVIIIIASIFLVFYITKSKGFQTEPILKFIEPINKNGYDVSKIVSIDEFGRKVEPLYDTKKDKYVGMFYFLCHGQHAGNGIYDVTDIIENHPDDLFNKQGTKYSPVVQHHFWGKPLLGYYNILDEYVLKKHMQE